MEFFSFYRYLIIKFADFGVNLAISVVDRSFSCYSKDMRNISKNIMKVTKLALGCSRLEYPKLDRLVDVRYFDDIYLIIPIV